MDSFPNDNSDLISDPSACKLYASPWKPCKTAGINSSELCELQSKMSMYIYDKSVYVGEECSGDLAASPPFLINF